MIVRRSLFAILAGAVGAVVTPLKAEASPSEINDAARKWVFVSDPRPRPHHYMPPIPARMAIPADAWPEYPRGKLFGRWISNGSEFVLIESEEGQEVLRSIAAPNAGQSRW